MMGAAIPPAGSQDLSALLAILASADRSNAALAELVKARDDAEASVNRAAAACTLAVNANNAAIVRRAEAQGREEVVTAREKDVEAKAAAMEASARKAADLLAAREIGLTNQQESYDRNMLALNEHLDTLRERETTVAQREAEVAALKATYDSALAKLKASVQAQLEKAFTP